QHIAGLAVFETLQSFGIDPQIRWINDTLIHGKKIAGILCSSEGSKAGGTIKIGIGVNVKMTPNQCKAIDQPATSLSIELGQDIDIEEVIERLMRKLQFYFTHLDKENVDEHLQKYNAALAYKGDLVTIFDGKNESVGIFKAINDLGQLIL